MAETLTREQLSEITHQLEHQRRELLEQIREQIRESEEADRFDRYSQLNDAGDYSVADLIGDMKLNQLDRETEHLREIEDAEARIQKGAYGECIDCGIDIRPQRLMAQPTATRCTQCQEKYERTHGSDRPSSNM